MGNFVSKESDIVQTGFGGAYPDNIKEIVRMSWGMDRYDTSRDNLIEIMSPNEVLDRVCNYEGIIGYGYKIRTWIEDIYGITLE